MIGSGERLAIDAELEPGTREPEILLRDLVENFGEQPLETILACGAQAQESCFQRLQGG